MNTIIIKLKDHLDKIKFEVVKEKHLFIIKLKDHLDKIKFEVVKEKHLSGHLYHSSPYECDDNCGTCDGARCEYCHEYEKVVVDKKSISLDDFIKIIIESTRNDQGEIIGYNPNHATLENWHSQLPILLNGGWDEGEWKDAKSTFSFRFLNQEFIFENFNEYDIPDEMVRTMYCLSVPSKDNKSGANTRLWFETKEEAGLMQFVLGTGHIFEDAYCNIKDKPGFILSIKEPS